ncbi:MAG: preprotein translocase subunit SecE, partial [Fimbriimonadaceae bacterium]
PRWADFLISVQAEIDRVTWPSVVEVKRATVVVLVLITSMAVVMFCFDLIWQWVFQVIGFLQIYRR